MPRPVPTAVVRGALHTHLNQPKNLLLTSLGQLDGQPAIRQDFSEFKTVHFQEGQFQYIFRVAARRRTGGRVHMAMVVAKGGQENSAMAQREYRHLRRLYRRRPQIVVPPLAGGPIPAPGGPPLFIYFTRWLASHHELGVDGRLNFFVNEAPLHHFSRQASERIRASILTHLFALYDPIAKTTPEPPQVASGDFVISRPTAGRPVSLRLIACRDIRRPVSLEGCLRLYLGYHGDWAGKVFTLVPKDPKLLFTALHEGLVASNSGTITWDRLKAALEAYAAELKQHNGVPPAFTPLSVVRKLLGSLHVFLKEIDSGGVKKT